MSKEEIRLAKRKLRKQLRRESKLYKKNQSSLSQSATSTPSKSATSTLSQSVTPTLSHSAISTTSQSSTSTPSQSSTPTLSQSVIECVQEKTPPSIGPATNGYESDTESDCEIIEVDNPIIVLDDDCVNEPDQENESANENFEQITVNESSAPANAPEDTVATISDSTVQNSVIEEETPPEPVPLFFIDKDPNTNCTAPIYEIAPVKEVTNNNNMAFKNFRITFANNGANNAANLPFTPNPLLSSTRLNESMDDSGASGISNNDSFSASGSGSGSASSSTPIKNFHISINSTIENTPKRTVITATKAAQKQQSDNADAGIVTKSRKRKLQKENREEPPSKKSSTDVIVLNDTISDEDSVIFVSETANAQKRNRISGNGQGYSGKAADFISLRNDTASQRKKAVSFFYKKVFSLS